MKVLKLNFFYDGNNWKTLKFMKIHNWLRNKFRNHYNIKN